MNTDKIAAEHIAELEAQLEDAYVKIDLLSEALDESQNRERVAIEQYRRVLNAQKADLGVA